MYTFYAYTFYTAHTLHTLHRATIHTQSSTHNTERNTTDHCARFTDNVAMTSLLQNIGL